MTRDEAFQEYEEALAEIDKRSREASENARAKLKEQLKTLQDKAHEELGAIRKITQSIKKRR